MRPLRIGSPLRCRRLTAVTALAGQPALAARGGQPPDQVDGLRVLCLGAAFEAPPRVGWGDVRMSSELTAKKRANHLETCFSAAVQDGRGQGAIDELIDAVKFTTALTFRWHS